MSNIKKMLKKLHGDFKHEYLLDLVLLYVYHFHLHYQCFSKSSSFIVILVLFSDFCSFQWFFNDFSIISCFQIISSSFHVIQSRFPVISSNFPIFYYSCKFSCNFYEIFIQYFYVQLKPIHDFEFIINFLWEH